jgi:hypothetical protein
MLTGAAPEQEPLRLSTVHGYHPGAVRLWETTTNGRAEAAGLIREVESLLRGVVGSRQEAVGSRQ